MTIEILTLQNNLKGEVKKLRLELERLLDKKGYEVKVSADYNISIVDNETDSAIDLKVWDFQNESEDDEIITKVELSLDADHLIEKEEVVDMIIHLINEARD